MNDRIRRTQAVLALLARPADAWLVARTLGWMCALPLLKRVIPLSRLVSLMCRRPRSGRAGNGDVTRMVRIVGRLCRVSGGNCLERSLILYRFLGRAGAEPQLVVGLGKLGDDFLGHVWVTVRGQPLLDSPAALLGYDRVVTFDSWSGRDVAEPKVGQRPGN